MALEICKECGDYIITPSHKCPPIFEFHHPYWDDWVSIRARDHESAAEKFGELFDNGDYTILNGSTETVSIRDSDGVIKRFTVSGEAVPQYYAREICDDDEKEE